MIVELLERQAEPYQKVAQGELQEQVIVDIQHNQFQWLTIGWDNEDDFKSLINIHLCIKSNGKIWLMENNTDIRVAEELVRMGVPREDIVLGFQPPSSRVLSDYAIA